MSSILIECDPEKNTLCDKKNCHINGGPCKYTRVAAFGKADGKMLMVLDATEEDIKDIRRKPHGRKRKKKNGRRTH